MNSNEIPLTPLGNDEDDPCEEACDCLGYCIISCCCGISCADSCYRLQHTQKMARKHAREERLKRERESRVSGEAGNPADAPAALAPMTMVASRGAPPGDLTRVTVTYPDGNQYEGTVNATNKPHGVVADGNGGVYRYTNGHRYEGDFVDGLMDGHGRMIYASGNVFEGAFKGGKKHGQGSLSYSSRAPADADGAFTMSGVWVQGEAPTRCRQVYGNGNVYTGEIKGVTREGTYYVLLIFLFLFMMSLSLSLSLLAF
jgi:hypothetical protein